MLTGGNVEGCPTHDSHVHETQSADASFSRRLRVETGEIFPCGHFRTWRNTQTVNGVERCRHCRRERWERGFRIVVIRKMRAELEAAQKRIGDLKVSAQKNRNERVSLAAQNKEVERALEAAIPRYDRDGGRRFPLDVLIRSVAAHFDMTPEQVVSKSRGRDFVLARAVVIKILRERGVSYPRTGQLIGDRDHSTILNAIRQFPNYLESDWRVKEAYNGLRDLPR